MKVLGIESSCDETGVALVETRPRRRRRACWPQALHSQVDDARRPTAAWCPNWPRATTSAACCRWRARCWPRPAARWHDIDLVAYTRGPGLAGALLVGAGVAVALAAALGKPALGVHHLEGHLLSPFLSATSRRTSPSWRCSSRAGTRS